MASYTGQQRFLLREAEKYIQLGYIAGFCKGKEFLGSYVDQFIPEEFDGISLIPEGMVCVDIDVTDFGVVGEDLPPTLKEKTPRGGIYDVECQTCEGNKVVLAVDESRLSIEQQFLFKQYQEYKENRDAEDAEERRTCYMENGGYDF